MLERRAGWGFGLLLAAACGTGGGGTRDGGSDASGRSDDGSDGSDGGDGVACVATDEPDPMGLDTNCDGVDGERARGVFVAIGGDDAAPGTPDRPVRTLAHAIELAGAGMRYVLVAAGTYDEALTVRAGVSLHGGYDTGYRGRHTGATRVAPGSGSALVADGLMDARTVVSGFTFASAAATVPGTSSIAARVRAAAMLELTDDVFEAGAGAPGVAGASGAVGMSGMPGSPGGRGVPCRAGGPCAMPYMYPAESPPLPGQGGRGCLLGTSGGTDYYSTGGAGGAAGWPGYYPPSSPNHDGVAGGSGVCAPLSCTMNTRGGLGGTTSLEPVAPTRGSVGSDGASGADGAAGMPGGPGTFAFDGFTPAAGTDGTIGVPGSGGGGGGGGGGYLEAPRLASELLYFGAAGSGGGGGGCGGTAGHGGGGGGASVGLIVSGAAPRLTRVVVHTETGGVGGTGGAGGAGGMGGTGGTSTSAWVEAGIPRGGSGGAGGAGGSGGHGGVGGGGAGGPSVGVVLLDGATLAGGDATFMLGAGGAGNGGAPAGMSRETASF